MLFALTEVDKTQATWPDFCCCFWCNYFTFLEIALKYLNSKVFIIKSIDVLDIIDQNILSFLNIIN